MNKYKKAFYAIGDTIIYYTISKDLASLPSDNEIFDSLATLSELVDKETSKKPIDVEFGPCVDLMLCCTTCKHGVVPSCPFCGQKLKEGDEDEK